MTRLRSYVRQHHLALIALFVALGGVSYAAVNLPPKSVGTKHLKRNAVVSSKVKNRSLLRRDFRAGQLPRGPRGATGPQGATGPAGSPDTPQQVLGKLEQVDGSGSGLDADTLDGVNSETLPTVVASGTHPWDPPSLTADQCTNAQLLLTSDELQPSDVVTVSDSSATRVNSLDIHAFILAGVSRSVYAVGCNNSGTSTVDQGPLTLSYMVERP